MKNRKKFLVSFALIVALILTFIVNMDNLYAGNEPENEESINQFTEHLNDRITSIMKTYHIPGVSIALIHRGEMVWSNAYGYADVEAGREMTVDTVCRVESISKSYFSTLP